LVFSYYAVSYSSVYSGDAPRIQLLPSHPKPLKVPLLMPITLSMTQLLVEQQGMMELKCKMWNMCTMSRMCQTQLAAIPMICFPPLSIISYNHHYFEHLVYSGCVIAHICYNEGVRVFDRYISILLFSAVPFVCLLFLYSSLSAACNVTLSVTLAAVSFVAANCYGCYLFIVLMCTVSLLRWRRTDTEQE